MVHADAGNVALLDPATGRSRAIVRVGAGPCQVALSADGRTAVVSNYGFAQGSSTLSVIDVPAARLTRTISLRYERREPGAAPETITFHRPHGICFLPDQRHVLVTCEAERMLLKVDVVDALVVAAIETEQELSHMVTLSRDGRRAFVANAGSGSISVVDLDRRRVEKVIETGGGSQGMAMHPTRDELWVANVATNSISIVDTEKLEELTEFACGAYPTRLAFTTDGKSVLCVNKQAGTISVLSTEHKKVQREIELERLDAALQKDRPLPEQHAKGKLTPLPQGILVHPDGGRAYVACSRSDRIAEIDVTTWEVVRYLDSERGPDSMAWSRYEDDHVSAK